MKCTNYTQQFQTVDTLLMTIKPYSWNESFCIIKYSLKCLWTIFHMSDVVPFCIIYSLHLFVVWFLQAIWLPEWSLQLPSFLAFYVSKGRAGRSNTSLRTLVTFTPLFISSPECAHLSPNTCKILFMLLHLILCCPSPYCIPHAIIECRMTILISYFPCLAARFSPRENWSIRPLAPLFAYLWIWNSLIRKNVGSLIRWFSSMRFHFDQEGCCPCCNSLS